MPLTNEQRKLFKNIYYLISSNGVGYHIYKNDEKENTILIAKLVCDNCRQIWETSMTECFYCGSPNHFVKTCIECNKIFSITKNNNTCDQCDKKTLKVICINKNCPSRDDTKFPLLSKRITEKETFKKNDGNMIRQNSCKNCGNRINKYIYSEVKIIFDDYEDSNGIEDDIISIKPDYDNDGSIIYFNIQKNNEEKHIKSDNLKKLRNSLDEFCEK